MQIYATFEHSIYTELALTHLQQVGITDIFAVPLDEINDHPKIFDTIHRSDGVSFINKGIALSVVFSTILSSRGFLWEWGPIIWGLIGAGGGFLLGLAIDLCLYKFIHKRKIVSGRKKIYSEIIVIINCNDQQAHIVTDILTKNRALGLAKIKKGTFI
ncbi:hypothetical protein [Metabacillus fastidiosus]|uniref:hypothetical protein n=1 Tax=Metabacillus fastidiosus TaxID=1458 RepID=UPI002DBD4B55|nr:hypothetical protein [Metabacillus fastidiosus]MEC2078503.1 hypothetical protein [Metabacillus fastidiosus]